MHGFLLPKILEWVAISFSRDIGQSQNNRYYVIGLIRGFPGGSVGKSLLANTRDMVSISGSGGTPGEGNGNPLQNSCLGNPMDGGAWRAADRGVAKSRLRPSMSMCLCEVVRTVKLKETETVTVTRGWKGGSRELFMWAEFRFCKMKSCGHAWC